MKKREKFDQIFQENLIVLMVRDQKPLENQFNVKHKPDSIEVKKNEIMAHINSIEFIVDSYLDV